MSELQHSGDGMGLSPRERELWDAMLRADGPLHDLAGGQAQRRRMERHRLRRRTRIVGTALAILGAGAGIANAWYNQAQELSSEEKKAAASLQVLRSATALSRLGLCAAELRAQVQISEYAHTRAVRTGERYVGPGGEDIAHAADLAELVGAPCASDETVYAVDVQGMPVYVSAADITPLHVPSQCDRNEWLSVQIRNETMAHGYGTGRNFELGLHRRAGETALATAGVTCGMADQPK